MIQFENSSEQLTTEEFTKIISKVEQLIQEKIPLAIREENSPPRVLQFRLSFKDAQKFGAVFEELEQLSQIKVKTIQISRPLKKSYITIS